MSSSPYCKTCHNAGKSYLEYTNHWTRDKAGPDGKIVCPVILNTICGYCKQKGHWIKFCPSIKERNTTNDQDKSNNYSSTQNINSWANKLKHILPQNEFRPTSPDYPPPPGH